MVQLGYKCPKCGKKFDVSISEEDFHNLCNGDTVLFKCSQCGGVFIDERECVLGSVDGKTLVKRVQEMHDKIRDICGLDELEDSVKRHEAVCRELTELYERKNRDYGNSFHESYAEWGLPMAAIRIGDKYRRLATLAKGAERNVADESVRDTLLDLANYAVMALMELRNS